MDRARNISKSMMSYLRRAREHKEFLLRETKEFERGKRHLANMMGIDSQEMTQADIDKAIDYLFPSGLFDKKARPMMKHPDLLYKTQKDAQFDVEGRPHHHLFYTVKPNYYQALSELAAKLRDLNKHEDEQLAKGVIKPPDDAKYHFSGRDWIDVRQLSSKFLESLAESEHEYFIKSIQYLVDHPYSLRAKSFIEQYSVALEGSSMNLELPEIIRDEETGQIYTDMVTRRREHCVQVKTILNGSGQINIEGKDILFFSAPYQRRAVYFPLQISGMQDKVDIIAKVVRQPQVQGPGTVAIAIRFAVSRSIAAFVDEETRERMRLAGLLTEDTRIKERKKFGQEGARRKYTWKKR